MGKRQVFYSFHFAKDSWRAAKIKNIGVIEGNTPVSSNEWENVKRKGKDAIEKWINDAMNYRTCVVVLIGSETYSREWCNYEVQHAWKEGKGIVGIYIHGLEDAAGNQSEKGPNPFENFYIDKTINYIAQRKTPIDNNEINLSHICKAYDPPYITSKGVYGFIEDNIDRWCEEAIRIRNQYPK